MPDKFSKETRSRIMQAIKGKNTQPELFVRKYLFSRGFRYRLHAKELPGRPDIVLPKYKTVILIHGCFWHGHEGCKNFILPKTRAKWWKEKIEKNKLRDKKNDILLRELGWNIIILFECQLTDKKLNQIIGYILKRSANVQ